MLYFDDSLAKQKIDYAKKYFMNKLEKNKGIISNNDKKMCVRKIKDIFGDYTKRTMIQAPFLMIDMSENEFINRNISTAKLLIYETLEDDGILIKTNTMDTILNTSELANKRINNSNITVGEYVNSLIKYQYPGLLSKQILPNKYEITSCIDRPTYNDPIYGEIKNGIILSNGVLLNGLSVCIYYYSCKNKLRIINLYHLINKLTYNQYINPINDSWKAIWVTTTASKVLNSRENIKKMVLNCKNAGINNIFIVVYNNAGTTYPSDIMKNLIGRPIKTEFIGRDPLRECIEEGKLMGLKIHAWFEYGFASSYSAAGGPIIAAKPHWAAKDKNGNLLVKNGFDWLNGFHPEVQQFMIDLFKEVLINYDIDGVQGDDRIPAMPTTGSYDNYTVSLYQSENNGAYPSDNPIDPIWLKWRSNKLMSFLKKLRDEIKRIKPYIYFSISPSPYPWGYNEYLQDWPSWVRNGYVDAILPQCYRRDIQSYESVLKEQIKYHQNSKIPMYPGVLLRIGTYIATPNLLTDMIQTNRNNHILGESFFFYEGLPSSLHWFETQYTNIHIP